MNNNKVKCPVCQLDINGESFNCSVCDNTGFVTKEEAKQLIESRKYFDELLNKNNTNE